MQEIVFDSQLLIDGHLSCPPRYAKPDARFKVIASIPDEDASENDIEQAAAEDLKGDFLSEVEVEYYMQLDDQ